MTVICKQASFNYLLSWYFFFNLHAAALQNSKRISKILNFEHSEHWMSEHRTFWTSLFGPKLNIECCWSSQKTEQFANIKLYVPKLVWSHKNQTKLQTLPNITFWPKTELRTCWTSQKTEQFANIELFVPRPMPANGISLKLGKYHSPVYLLLY